jgi:Transposase DDE domain
METTQISPSKDTYKIKNWKKYNKSLEKRGDFSIWIEGSVLSSWIDLTPKKVVGECLYPNAVIETCLILSKIYHQKLRQTVGFVRSLMKIMGHKSIMIPDFSTLSRRQSSLKVEFSNAFSRLEKGEKLDICIDSTGLKVYGEGEWKVRKHGASKRRTWQKLHIGINAHTQEIISAKLTTNSEDDAATAKVMLKDKIHQIKSFRGDGAYDDTTFRKCLGDEVTQIIPPPKNAVVCKPTKKKPVPAHLFQRNTAVERIAVVELKEWKKEKSYHVRSLNEVAMFRFKTVFGGELDARKFENQETEVLLKCKILNRFAQMGMPQSQRSQKI